ncbi:MAG TPA: branched-chain amino acid ABC transporter permease [Firmicutes bacterium]|nr:branched-chain amino acid ABC transporter permease [Bacillota bacterium]
MNEQARAQKKPFPVARIAGVSFVIVTLWALAVLVIGGNAYYEQILTLVCINIMMVVGLNLINGFTGMLSIGHAGFMSVGAYIAAFMTRFYGLNFHCALLVGGLAACLVGVVVGLPTLRLRGDYLAIATLGFGEIIRVIIINIEKVGGPRGFVGIPPQTTFLITYIWAAATVLFIMHFMNSTYGRACLAVREDEIAAEAMGVNTTYYKVLAFCIGSFFAGVAGGLLAHKLTFLHPMSFGFLKSVEYLIMVVIGGYGSITGSVLAAGFLTILSEVLRTVQEWRMIAYSVLLIALMLTRPEGLLGGIEFTFAGLRRLRGGAWLKRFQRNNGQARGESQ